MKSLKNANNGIDFRNGIDHIFSQMQEFLRTLSIQSKEDIVMFFNTFVNHANQLIAFYFDHTTKGIEKEFSPVMKNEEGQIISEEGKYYEIMEFFLRGFYELKENDFEWQINNHTTDEENPLTARDIHVSYDIYVGTLENAASQENFSQILKEFQQAIKKINNEVLRILEKEKRANEIKLHKRKQKAIESKNAKAIKELLSNSSTDIIICQPTFATEEDFVSGYHSAKNVIHEIYAEKEEYFNNLFLGFDFHTGRFQSSAEKEKQYKKYFYEKKGVTRLQETNQLDTSKNLPAIISDTTLDIFDIIQNNTRSILQTDEQKIDAQIKDSIANLVGDDKDRENIKRIIFERYKKYEPKTEEEKNKIIWKVISSYYDVRRYRGRKLDISIPLSTGIKIYIGDHIRGCCNYVDSSKLRNADIEKIIATLPDKRKDTIALKKERIDQRKKLLGEEIFGEGFDFNALLKDKQSDWDIRFYLKMGGIKQAYSMMLKGIYPGNKRIDEFLEGMEILDNSYDKYIQEMLQTYTFSEDIGKIKNIEKEVQEKFDSAFVLNSEILGDILYATIKQTFDNQMLWYDDKGISNIEKNIIDMTKRISLYGIMYNKDNSFVVPIYQKALHTLKEMYQFRIFLKIVKRLGLPIEYDKGKVQEILQKEYNELQYNVNDFGVRQINELEDIKKIALDFSVKLDLPPTPPLETYYIHRLRTPERILDKQSKENTFDRYSGTFGYEKGNLASVISLEELAQEIGMTLRREEALNIDMRAYKNVPRENRFDVDVTVPVIVNFPKVRTILSGNWDEKGVMQGHYVFLYDPKAKLYSLIFDDSFMNASLLIQKYKFFEELILGGGFLVFDKNTASILVEDRIDEYNHEPRILSITALKNAVKDILPEFRIFIGNDGIDKIGHYF